MLVQLGNKENREKGDESSITKPEDNIINQQEQNQNLDSQQNRKQQPGAGSWFFWLKYSFFSFKLLFYNQTHRSSRLL